MERPGQCRRSRSTPRTRHLERVRLDVRGAERLAQRAAGCHVGERRVRGPVGRTLVVDDEDVASVTDDRGKARRIDCHIHRRIGVDRADVFEEGILRERVSGKLGLRDHGGGRQRLKQQTKPNGKADARAHGFRPVGAFATGRRHWSARYFSCGEYVSTRSAATVRSSAARSPEAAADWSSPTMGARPNVRSAPDFSARARSASAIAVVTRPGSSGAPNHIGVVAKSTLPGMMPTTRPDLLP